MQYLYTVSYSKHVEPILNGAYFSVPDGPRQYIACGMSMGQPISCIFLPSLFRKPIRPISLERQRNCLITVETGFAFYTGERWLINVPEDCAVNFEWARSNDKKLDSILMKTDEVHETVVDCCTRKMKFTKNR